MLRERLSRKEDLLRDYEKDLGKLRQAEVLLRERDMLVQDLAVSSSHSRENRMNASISALPDGQTIEG